MKLCPTPRARSKSTEESQNPSPNYQLRDRRRLSVPSRLRDQDDGPQHLRSPSSGKQMSLIVKQNVNHQESSDDTFDLDSMDSSVMSISMESNTSIQSESNQQAIVAKSSTLKRKRQPSLDVRSDEQVKLDPVEVKRRRREQYHIKKDLEQLQTRRARMRL